ncbi:MAG: ATP-binding protein, partial [Candidatus Sericytochromatia bacterium]
MRYLVEESVLQLRYGTWFLPTDYTSWELPTSIEATVTRRLNTLSSKAMELIRLAAVAGRKLRLSLFKAVSQWEEEDIFTAIDELIERQFLNRIEHEYLFPHDRVRETLYDSLEEEKRKELHFRVAETIENENLSQITSVAGELAYHFSRSVDSKRAVKYLLMAGFSSPVRMEASQLLKQATDLLENLNEDFTESWLNNFLFEICGRNENTVNQMREKAGDSFNKDFVLEQARRKLAWISYMISPPICLSTSEKLIEYLQAQGKGLEDTAEFESIRASSYTMMGQNDKAFSITNPIINNESYEGTLVRGLMLFGRLNGLLTTGRFRQLVQDMEMSADTLERNFSKLHPPLIWAYGFSSFIREDAIAWLGEELDENSKYQQTLVEIGKKHSHLDLEFWSYYPNVVRHSLTGHYDKIKNVQEKLMNMVKRMGRPIQHENRFNVCLAFAAIQNGQLLEAKSMVKKIVELGQRLGNPHQQANGFILEAMVLMEENKFPEA